MFSNNITIILSNFSVLSESFKSKVNFCPTIDYCLQIVY